MLLFLHRLIAPRLRAALALAAAAPLLAFAQAGSTPLLYEVRSPSNTVYLFGTIHVGARTLYPLSAQVEASFANAQVLALEADPTEGSGASAAMALGMYTPPDTLADHISPELYAQLQAVLPQVGLPIEFARAMKPYLLAMTVAMLEIQRLGYDPALGLDAHFARRARAAGKPIVQLESMEEQMALFEGLPPATQEALLRMAVKGVADGRLAVEVSELMAAWKAGDVPGIQRSVTRELEDLPGPAAEALRERLYERRNHAMAAKVSAMLAGTQPHFVAVGAGHLIGPTGLPELLRKQGYEVRRP
jgi:uncharacterized protein YbaP (TraB family)